MIHEYGAVGRMRTDRLNRSTPRKPVPVPFFPPQIPKDLTWDRRRAVAVEDWRLSALWHGPEWMFVILWFLAKIRQMQFWFKLHKDSTLLEALNIF
jgi:hypothetical protein